MRLFGNLPAPAWFASEVLALGTAGVTGSSSTSIGGEADSNEQELKALKLFILNQAARFSLSDDELITDLQRCGMPAALARSIGQDYNSTKIEHRQTLLYPERFPSVHGRVIQAQFVGSDRISMSLTTGEALNLILTKDTKQDLAEALEEAVAAFEGLS